MNTRELEDTTFHHVNLHIVFLKVCLNNIKTAAGIREYRYINILQFLGFSFTLLLLHLIYLLYTCAVLKLGKYEAENSMSDMIKIQLAFDF